MSAKSSEFTPLPQFRARRVISRLRRGSSSPVIVDTEAGRFVTKLRGAAQGTPALIAEVIVAELAEAVGLPVPERVLVEFESPLESDDKNDELQDLLMASIGTNLGFRWLPGAEEIRETQLGLIDRAFRARVLWLDGLSMNPDRTLQNPNILLWKRQPWLIDHGAALSFQYSWARVTEQDPREKVEQAQHLFSSSHSELSQVDASLASLLTREVVEAAVLKVPDDFFSTAFPGEDLVRLRCAYQAFLWKRLKAPRPFIFDSAPTMRSP